MTVEHVIFDNDEMLSQFIHSLLCIQNDESLRTNKTLTKVVSSKELIIGEMANLQKVRLTISCLGKG